VTVSALTREVTDAIVRSPAIGRVPLGGGAVVWYYALVSVLGAGVAIGELVSRYRDSPIRAVLTPSALLYVVINAGASAGALAIARAFDWHFGAEGSANSAAVQVTQALVAGFGAIAFFRSSLFIVRVGNQDVGMGPSAFLQSVLEAADRGVDRGEANVRSSVVSDVMQNVEFEKAFESLPAYCLALMQNVPEGVQTQVGRQVDAMRGGKMSDSAKALLLGLLLMNVVGGAVLRSAVSGLGRDIRRG
jgi:hypothetical protein